MLDQDPPLILENTILFSVASFLSFHFELITFLLFIWERHFPWKYDIVWKSHL